MVRTSFTVSVDKEVYQRLEKRAKRELQSVPELAEQVLRRSVINMKSSPSDKLDDKFVGLFSRKRKK
ncbi:ribbon-helix-helix protein, CopG family [Candidatus Pacearchaeota archaeon]|nr:ribbon-helix-helix protein, CopG family [Candidatus Pacearchaeota archaeon]